MKLWLISQTENEGYDTYDSAIVVAESVEQARAIHPSKYSSWNEHYSSWASSPEHVSAVCIGTAQDGIQGPVILASFNAG